jgi:hypothetical protein|nr:MAG TPA: minor capsid component [Caudoviricetes sp.]
MNELYNKADDKDVSTAFVFDDKALQRALKHIYEKDFHPMTEIEENLFNETFRAFTEATNDGVSQSSAEVPTEFRQKMDQGNAIFSAFKVHRMQNDIAAQMYDSNGVLKPFEQWKKDVHPMLDHHVEHWLKTEYDTAVIRARQAADWQRFEQYADILPNLEWMPSTSANPGADHKVFWGTILPINHSFWNAHRPGDRWNCKCSLSATDEPPTGAPRESTDPKNQPAPGLDNNPGVDGRLFSDTHPYVSNAYDGAKEAVKAFLTERVYKKEDAFYADPKTGKELDRTGKFFIDPAYGKRLKTSVNADITEVEENTRAAKALLDSFQKMSIRINEHVLEEGRKNPEYTVNGKTADRKGIESEQGITSGFKKAIKQGCEIVIIDLDAHLKEKTLKVRDLSRHIYWRKTDFEKGIIQSCYVIYRGRAVVVRKADMGRDKIENVLKQLEP